jgi:hypothetical protein
VLATIGARVPASCHSSRPCRLCGAGFMCSTPCQTSSNRSWPRRRRRSSSASNSTGCGSRTSVGICTEGYRRPGCASPFAHDSLIVSAGCRPRLTLRSVPISPYVGPLIRVGLAAPTPGRAAGPVSPAGRRDLRHHQLQRTGGMYDGSCEDRCPSVRRARALCRTHRRDVHLQRAGGIHVYVVGAGEGRLCRSHVESAVSVPAWLPNSNAVHRTGRPRTRAGHFNPLAPSQSQTSPISRAAPAGLACPLPTQCTEVDFGDVADGGANEVTFDPQAPASSSFATLASSSLTGGIAYPPQTQCTASEQMDGTEMTFNPQAPTTPTPVPIGAGAYPTAIACPSTTQCTIVEETSTQDGAPGSEVTFNPQAPSSPTPAMILATGALTHVACPSLTLCVATYGPDSGNHSGVVAFDPQAPTGATNTALMSSATQIFGIDCPSTSECVLIDGDSHHPFFEGAPGASSSAWTAQVGPQIGQGTFFWGISCPSATDDAGEESTGTVTSGGSGSPSEPGSSPGKVSLGKTHVSGDTASILAELRRRHHEEIDELRAALAAAPGENLELRRKLGTRKS